MRRNLLDLLTERPIVHPTRIDSVTWSGRQLTIAVGGHPWLASPHEGEHREGAVSLVFTDLGEGRLFTDELEPDDDEALEDFEILPVSDVPWAQAHDWSIYCSAPISEPIALFAKIHDYLRRNEAFMGPEHFLNGAGDMSHFAAMTSTAGFLISRGPTCIRDLICAELDRQHVPHTVIQTTADTEPRYLVRLGDSAFLCEEALADLPD
jgi:hypothetical protein